MITHFLTTLLIVNMPIFALQFYNGIDRDFITGMFGNNMTGIVSQLFLIVICIKLKDLYFNKINIINVLMWLVMSIIYFAIAEVKFGFFSISILLLIFFIFISRGISSIIAIALAALIIVGGYNVYMTTYSQQDFLNYKFLERYLVEQNYSGDSVNRISFKSRIDDVVFHNDKIDKLVGKGLGSGNPSDYQLLKGTLYDKYDYLKYHWFLLPYLYLENGIIGIVLFVAIYVFILIKSYVCYVRYKSEQGLLVFLTSIVNLIYLLYNNSILTYTIMTIYWFFFGLISIEHRNKDINESL
jgi:O-antigen ligase